jgi:zinc and cadmium transporter
LHYHAAVSPIVIAVALSALGSIGGLLTASSLLLFRDRARRLVIPWLISYAVGTMLGVALLGLLPEALGQLEASVVLGTLLGGILLFFILEKVVLWRHCHTDECELHSSAAPLVLVGDMFHNFIDGAIISAAVLTSVPLGVSTALAVVAHEIPQEVGDFAILLGAGYTRRQALLLNLLSGTSAIVGAVLMYVAVSGLPVVLPYVLPFAAGGLLYVAMADLIPDLHRGAIATGAFRQILLISAGIATVLVL